MRNVTHHPFKVLMITAAALTLVACGKTDDRSVGQQIDSSIAKVEQKTEQAKTEVKQEMAEAKASTEAATDKLASKIETASDKVANSVQDASITTSVNAELAKDKQLSALKINVDTLNGAVKLMGTAPDKASRERAARLAAAVKGVTSVDNQLVVQG